MREDVKTALLNMYSRIDEARARQVATGSVDQGNRQGITSGQHMAGLIDLIRNDLISAGIGENEIFSSRVNVTLPGWYRATKDWDMLAFCDEKLLAAIELKSINSSFGNNINNRIEESLGSAVDVITSFSEGLFGESQIPPCLGYVMIVRSCSDSRRLCSRPRETFFDVDPIFNNTSYLDRFKILCSRMRQKNIYNAVWLVFVDPDNSSVVEPVNELTYEKFIATIKAVNDIHLA